MLCFCCNQALGNLRDRADIARAAAAYLETHKFPAERRPGQDARDELPAHVLETVRPVTGNISHLIENLDRRKVQA